MQFLCSYTLRRISLYADELQKYESIFYKQV